MMTRLQKLALAVVGIVIALGVAIAMLGPSLVQDTVESQLRGRLERRGIDADWTEFNAGFGKRFEIKGLTLNDPKHGLNVTTDRVVVVVSIDSLIANDPRLEAISLENVRVKMDLAQQRKNESKPATKKSSGKRGLVERLLDDPPTIQVANATIEISRGKSAIATISTDAASVSIDDGKMVFDTTVVAEPQLSKLPQSLRTKVSARLGFELDVPTGALSFELLHPEDDRPLFSYEDDQLGALRLGSVRGTANLQTQTADVELDYFSGRVGPSASPAVAVEVPRVLAGLNTNGDVKLTLVDASILVTPKRRALILDTLRAARSLFNDSKKTKANTGTARSPVKRAVAILERSDLSFKRVRVSLNIEGNEPDVFTRLTVLERFDATAKGGKFRAFGETAEGTFSAEASLVQGQTLPQYFRFEMTDVNLDKIPGMPKQRSKIPSRGTSGRLGGVVSGQLTLMGLPRGAATASVLEGAHGSMNLIWDDGIIDLTGVSDQALKGINIASEAEFSWFPARNEIRIENGKIKRGPVKIDFSSEVTDFPLDTTFVFRAAMEEVDCQKAVRAFPRALLGPYRRVELEGEIAPSMYFKLPIFRPRGLKLAFYDYEDLCKITSLNVPKRHWPKMRISAVAPTGPHKSVNGFPPSYDPNKRDDVYWLNRPFIKPVNDEGVSDPENVDIFVGPGMASYVPLSELPPYVGGAMYLSEQMLFYKAPAISVSLIKKALRLNLERGRFVYGGSTITQQLVKNLFLSRDKTLARKFQEALISWRIINTISRDRILELYLNCIEFGPDIYGIGPAAEYYFQKDARDLTAKEAIFLSMLKPAPWYGAKVVERKKSPVTGWWAERFELMYQRLIDENMFTRERAEAEKPYILTWDASGRYIKPKARITAPDITVDLFD